jgi:hypothetical protein
MSIYASTDEIGMTDEETTGTVLQYHGSHIYPTTDDHAAIYLATIPGHCVPGHIDDEWGPVGPFLRVSIAPEGLMIATDVLLTVAGAFELRNALDSWLEQPKSLPVRKPSDAGGDS